MKKQARPPDAPALFPLDFSPLMHIIKPARAAAIAVAVAPNTSFELEGSAAYRYGGRLFLALTDC